MVRVTPKGRVPIVDIVGEVFTLVAGMAATQPAAEKLRLAGLAEIKSLFGRMSARPLFGTVDVAVVGLTNVGKSTLINALLGCPVASVKNQAWSSVPVVYKYGKKYQALVEFAGTPSAIRKECADESALQAFLERYTTAKGKDAGTVDRVTIQLPAVILTDGLVLIDTPGFGAAVTSKDAGEMHPHTKTLNDAIDLATEVFLVVRLSDGVTQSTLDFFNARLRRRHRCGDIIVTQCDGVNNEDRESFVRLHEKTFGVPRLRFRFADGARRALGRGKVPSDIAALRKNLRELSRPGCRSKALGDRALLVFHELIRRWSDERVLVKTNLAQLAQVLYRAREAGLELLEKDMEKLKLLASLPHANWGRQHRNKKVIHKDE